MSIVPNYVAIHNDIWFDHKTSAIIVTLLPKRERKRENFARDIVSLSLPFNREQKKKKTRIKAPVTTWIDLLICRTTTTPLAVHAPCCQFAFNFNLVKMRSIQRKGHWKPKSTKWISKIKNGNNSLVRYLVPFKLHQQQQQQ